MDPYVAAGLAGYQIIAGLQQAEMVRMQAGIQAQIDEYNAQLSEYDAWRAEGYGQTQVARYQSEIDQTAAQGRVQAAAAGADITEGSLSEVVEQNKQIGILNKMDIENQAHERALGYTRQARNIRFGSQLKQLQSGVQAASIVGGSIARAAGTAASGYFNPKAAVSGDSFSSSGGSSFMTSESGFNPSFRQQEDVLMMP